ncbi:MAG TPA: AMP-binding protein [Xanthobacteraceae bacterium]|jgi:phenylacetate-CoA ligase|nr:AMP-binding protein [Xanthobacteraceae bacterium]
MQNRDDRPGADSEHLDALETRDPGARIAEFEARLPGLLESALRAPGWRRHLGDVAPRSIDSLRALARLPLLRKSDLIALQRELPPFAGLHPQPLATFGRAFTSPGPIYETEGRQDDPWRAARGLFAAGLRRGDLMLNTFSYHLTPGGFIFDSGARALGCTVIPAGPVNSEMQLDVIEHLKPVAYAGTPDLLKILLDAASKGRRDVSSLRKAVVSGAAFAASLQAHFQACGIDAYQIYATADLGLVAYETTAREGLVVAENVLLEIVRPGTGEALPEGEVGEVVVTSFDPDRPWIRLALGDLSAVLPGPSPCGRTHTRIRGWLGRADQTTKVKGMFVWPEQVAEILRRHRELARARLVVGRSGEADTMLLRAEAAAASERLAAAVAETLRAVTKLSGRIELVAPGALPDDGKVIDDTRPAG